MTKTVHRMTVLLAVLLALIPAAVGLAQGDEAITLVPFTDETFGLQGMIPDGWTGVAPGVYARAGSALDMASLIIQHAAGMTQEAMVALLLPQLGVEALPESAGTLATESYDWTLYVVPVEAAGMSLTIDIGLHEDEAGTTLVILQAQEDDYAGLHEAVFLPAVEALAPLEVAAAEAEELPYTAEDVTFDNPDAEAVTLAGTLTLPPGDGPHPALVLMSGSGAQDRDESLAPAASIKPFALIADALTRAGIAVLRYDDRGVGDSTGDFAAATGEDLAGDASAAIDYLRTRDEINPEQVGLLGHSEGGAMAPYIAARNPGVAFVISMAGTGVNGAEVLLLQNERILAADGATQEAIDQQVSFIQDLIDLTLAEDWDGLEALVVAQTLRELENLPAEDTADIDVEAFAEETAAQQIANYQNWFPFFFRYDPVEDWVRVTVPVLALFGGLDMQVVAEQNAPPVEAALEAGGNPDYSIVIIEDANHLFQQAETGSPSEYGELGDTFHPDFLPTIIDWLLERVEVAAP